MFTHPLEERCFLFAKRVRDFCRRVKLDIGNIEDTKQLVRASGSVGANYIEANENLGKGDLKYRIKISRKEAKECMHFLGLIETFGNKELENEKLWLIGEALELRKIFSVIIQKLQNQENAVK
ncbi:MAG: four helix bundle protein [Segetibacter sp.]